MAARYHGRFGEWPQDYLVMVQGKPPPRVLAESAKWKKSEYWLQLDEPKPIKPQTVSDNSDGFGWLRDLEKRS